MFAFVLIHFGSNIKYLELELYFLIMLRNKTKNDIIYMYSINDTPKSYIDIIDKYMNVDKSLKIKIIPYDDKNITYDIDGFQSNYTSFNTLRTCNFLFAYTLTEYKKVCIIESDMILRHNIDKLFNYKSPAIQYFNTTVEKRNTNFKVIIKNKDDILEEKTIHNTNGGILLFRPSLKIFEKLKENIKLIIEKNIEFPNEKLFIYTMKYFFNIPIKYNFIHFALNHNKPIYKYFIEHKHKIYIYHFNQTEYKPLNIIQDNYIIDNKIKQEIVEYYKINYYNKYHIVIDSILQNIKNNNMIVKRSIPLIKSEIVVARYNEDLAWLNKLDDNIIITVYNKGENNIVKINKPNVKIIKLPNIGRESHTYLHHIISNYDNLADQIIFCQGDSIFHSPNFLDLINSRHLFEPIQPLSSYYWPEGEPPFWFYNPPKPLLDLTHNLWINNNPIHVEYMDNEFITQYPLYYLEDYFSNIINKVKESYDISISTLEFNKNRFNLKNVKLDELFPVCYAGLFAVNKNVILDNCIDFYNNIMSILIYDNRNLTDKIKLDQGLFLEKLWLVIFNYKKYNKNYISLKTNNYILEDKSLIILNNTANFNFYIIKCNIFISLYDDNKDLYLIFISRYNIYILHKDKYIFDLKKLKDNQHIQNILKGNNYVNFNISIKNNKLIINVLLDSNTLELLNCNLNKNINIKQIIIKNVSKDNKFIDLNK